MRDIILIKCSYLPENANSHGNNNPFSYSYDTTSSVYQVTPNKDGTCTIAFLKEGACDVIVIAQDNNRAMLKIHVVATPGEEDFCHKYGVC